MEGFIGPLRPGELPKSTSGLESTRQSTSSNDIKSQNTIGKIRKPRKFIRAGGGTTWEDPTLDEWDPDDYRVFCGDLGSDITDEILIKTFEKYPSFVKAKVIKDKRTSKTKGYAFVSFKDPGDYAKAIKEWDGKYIGSRPIKMRKSNWKDRNVEHVAK